MISEMNQEPEICFHSFVFFCMKCCNKFLLETTPFAVNYLMDF